MNSESEQSSPTLVLRAVRTQQAEVVDVYCFFVHGSDILRVADISRIQRENEELKGFQRKEIQAHVRSIVEFLDSGPVLFPNAIILALSPEVKFEPSRGPRPQGLSEVGASGTLTIPVRPEGTRVAWIVDGQQRSLALAKAKNSQIPVPVVGFVSQDLQTHREQFILVNKSKPLEARLINELLPEVDSLLPKGLAENRLPSELCNLLNSRTESPFFGLIKRASSGARGVISDQALITAIRNNLKPPLGALAGLRYGDSPSPDKMFQSLMAYWSMVRSAFPEAWGLDPSQSRLMHSAGIRSVAALMDSIMLRAESTHDPKAEVARSLERLAPYCAWTEGKWGDLGLMWNEIQGTPQHISKLTAYLIAMDRQLSRSTR